MRWVVAAALVVLLGTASGAEEEAGTIAGAGWVSCGEYAQMYQKDPAGTENYVYAWAQGYMSGLNYDGVIRKNLRGMSLDKQKEFIRAFCDQRPLANIVVAVRELFDQLPDR